MDANKLPDVPTVDAVVGYRIRRARTSQGRSLAEVVEGLADNGVEMSSATLSRMERGRRDAKRLVTVREWLALAVVLDVPPLDLLLPLGQRSAVHITPEVAVHPHIALDWIVGHEGLPGGDPSTYAEASARIDAWMKLRPAQTAVQRALWDVKRLTDPEGLPPSRKGQAEDSRLRWLANRTLTAACHEFAFALERCRRVGVDLDEHHQQLGIDVEMIKLMAAQLERNPNQMMRDLGLRSMMED